MIEEEKIREKRFVLERPAELRKLWSSRPGERLRLTYTYSDTALQKPDYIDAIEIAVESFNQLGLATLRYAPMVMGILPGNCPLDPIYLKEKYHNQISFTRNSNASVDEWGCGTRSSLLYSQQVKDFFGHPPSDSNLSLPAFSTIICITENDYFFRYGPGVLLHEFNHLFGVKHAHFSANNSNGILNIDIPAPDIDDIYYDDTILWDEKLQKLQNVFNIYPFTETVFATQYTLASPFSIQHYRIQNLTPYLSFNISRMEEILESYNSSASQKNDYFYLLNKFAGYPVVRTYQDILGLIQAIYYIAPDSLAGQTFDFPNHYLVEGIYISNQDQQKFIQLIDYLSAREEFVYPIFAQEKLSFTRYLNTNFSIDLIEQFKIVSINSRLITCLLLPNYNASLSLTLDANCQLTGNSNVTGIFPFYIRLDNHITRLQRELRLRIKEKILEKSWVILSSPQVQYVLFDNTTSINLIELCEAVAIPREKKLYCSLTESFSELRLNNCHAELKNLSKNYNFSVIFKQAEASKTCHIQILDLRNSASQNNFTFHDIPVLTKEHPIVQALLNKPEYFLWAAADQTRVDTAFLQSLQQGFQLVSIPLLQGFFEGLIDEFSIGHAYKSSLKFIPHLTLFALGYTSFLISGMTVLASIFTDFIREKLKGVVPKKLENYIQLVFFLLVTELEYMPSNLWQLCGQLEIFPEAIALLNKLFTQMALAPAIKTAAYLLSQNLMKCLAELPAQAPRALTQQKLSYSTDFFNAIKVARDKVFSKKILRPFAFFSRPAANSRDLQADTMNLAEIGTYAVKTA